MSLSRSISWPKLSLHYTEINNIMYAVKTLYMITWLVVMDTKLFTTMVYTSGLSANRQNTASSLKIVRKSQLHPNLLRNWHGLETIADALVEIRECTMQPISTNCHHHHRFKWPFSLFRVYFAINAGITLGELFWGYPQIWCWQNAAVSCSRNISRLSGYPEFIKPA